MRALDQLRQPTISGHQVIAVALRMRRGEPDALQAFHIVNRFQQLHEGGLAVSPRHVPLAVTRHDLPEQRDFLDALLRQLAAFPYNIRN